MNRCLMRRSIFRRSLNSCDVKCWIRKTAEILSGYGSWKTLLFWDSMQCLCFFAIPTENWCFVMTAVWLLPWTQRPVSPTFANCLLKFSKTLSPCMYLCLRKTPNHMVKVFLNQSKLTVQFQRDWSCLLYTLWTVPCTNLNYALLGFVSQ